MVSYRQLGIIKLMIFYQENVDDVLREFASTREGLTSKEAEARIKQYGLNVINIKGESLWRKLSEPFRSVFMAILGLAAVISLVTHEPLDAVIIIAIIIISATIYYVQRFSTERVLRALKKHDRQIVGVMRDGRVVDVSSEELVPGDIFILNEGQKVPADARLIQADNVRADESLLTGESVPVSKHVAPLKDTKQIYERTNMLFQGSFIISGEATAIVVATGNKTEFGQLAKLAGDVEATSPMQRKIDQLISQIVGVVAVMSFIVLILSVLRGMEVSEAFRFMISLAVSAVPEGLPVAISVVLVLGMRRLAKYQALVRNMSAIENVGILTTIATDKTGTLTKNQLTVQDTWQLSHPADLQHFAQYLYLSVNTSKGNNHDPLDSALNSFADSYKTKTPTAYELITMMPFEQEFAMSGNVWRHDKGYDVVVKGAPEHIISRCGLTAKEHLAAVQALHSLTGKGYRVIAIARLNNIDKEIAKLSDVPKKGLNLVGLVAVADELRPEAHEAVLAAQSAGVTVRMITGDHFETAYAIGKQLGLVEHREQVFDSRKMNEMTDAQLEKEVIKARVFSRVLPENKHRILTILKKNDITAMTGDGVNDVPALANAHIGVAMGSGSQIAKEAGDIVLLDNNFKSIIAALREGRVIFDNIRRMLFYLLSTSAGEVITMIGALIIGLPLPVAPVQILWINLVTDTALVIPLGLEPAEEDVMKRKPRHPRQSILNRFIISRMLAVAATMAVVTLAIFAYFLQFNSLQYAQTLAFSVLVVMQWANAFNARSETQSIFVRLKTVNIKFYIGLAIAMSLQALAIFGPLQEALHVAPVEVKDVVITGLIGAVAVISVGEIHKLIGRFIQQR